MVHFNTEYINIVLFQFSIVNFNMPAQHGDFHVLPQHDVLDNMFFSFCQQDQQDLLLHAWVQHFVEQHLFWRVDVNMQVDNIDFICFCPAAVFTANKCTTPSRLQQDLWEDQHGCLQRDTFGCNSGDQRWRDCGHQQDQLEAVPWGPTEPTGLLLLSTHSGRIQQDGQQHQMHWWATSYANMDPCDRSHNIGQCGQPARLPPEWATYGRQGYQQLLCPVCANHHVQHDWSTDNRSSPCVLESKHKCSASNSWQIPAQPAWSRQHGRFENHQVYLRAIATLPVATWIYVELQHPNQHGQHQGWGAQLVLQTGSRVWWNSYGTRALHHEPQQGDQTLLRTWTPTQQAS